jgi:hypothetical protein
MSRSFKKQPFSYLCGSRPTKDRRKSNQGVRRTQKAYIRAHYKDEEFLLPHRFECPWNEKYSWTSDGDKRWSGLTYIDYADYHEACIETWSFWFGDPQFTCWPPAWYVKMFRK